MRLRNIPGADEKVNQSPYTVTEPEKHRGCWNQLFGNANPIQIEIGMGKGRFITTLARQNPKINYIGIERYSSVLLRAIQRMEEQEQEISNLHFLCVDAAKIEDYFEKEEIDKVYLNFSDPWPKDRHAKRRLTSIPFMKRYHHILRKGGVVEFKTDNRDLFEFSLEQIPLAGWKIRQYTYDLHQDVMGEGNVMTEYEEKFSQEGNPICKLICER